MRRSTLFPYRMLVVQILDQGQFILIYGQRNKFSFPYYSFKRAFLLLRLIQHIPLLPRFPALPPAIPLNLYHPRRARTKFFGSITRANTVTSLAPVQIYSIIYPFSFSPFLFFSFTFLTTSIHHLLPALARPSSLYYPCTINSYGSTLREREKRKMNISIRKRAAKGKTET